MIRRSVSVWAKVNMGPPDPILGITEAFKKDENPNKINLGVGAYRDDSGKPWILPSVQLAEDSLQVNNKEYDPISGASSFCESTQKLVFGQTDSRIATVQTLSGTGALRVIGEFLKAYHDKPLYLPTPSWGNHTPIFLKSQLQVFNYRYYDPSINGANIDQMIQDLKKMPNQSIVLLHACAHNPTGADPTKQQWNDILKVIQSKQHISLFDMAYQGFASGKLQDDNAAVRLFLKHVDSLNGLIVCQSFAKNMGLYGERVGSLSVVGKDEEEKQRLLSQLKRVIRPMYSNPPIHGARLATAILQDAAMYEQWEKDLVTMSKRIIEMRQALKSHLKVSSKDWSHITNQIGMFCFSGLKPEEVQVLKSKYSVYLTGDGRISMAGVCSDNVAYLANAIHEVTK